MLTTQWNLGDEVFFWLDVPILAICAVFIIAGTISFFRTSDNIMVPVGAVAAILAFIMGIISAIVFFPFSAVYMQYKPVSGIVQQDVTSRFLSDGQGTTQNYLVIIHGQDYRCDDTRCSQLKRGEAVTLMCERQWQANSIPGYTCNWGRLGLND